MWRGSFRTLRAAAGRPRELGRVTSALSVHVQDAPIFTAAQAVGDVGAATALIGGDGAFGRPEAAALILASERSGSRRSAHRHSRRRAGASRAVLWRRGAGPGLGAQGHGGIVDQPDPVSIAATKAAPGDRPRDRPVSLRRAVPDIRPDRTRRRQDRRAPRTGHRPPARPPRSGGWRQAAPAACRRPAAGLWRQALIARGQRQPVLGPHAGAGDDIERQLQISDQPPDQLPSCCQSFSPKNAASGWVMLNSSVTTVATPSKWPRAMVPSSGFGHARNPDRGGVIGDRPRPRRARIAHPRKRPQQFGIGQVRCADIGRNPRDC